MKRKSGRTIRNVWLSWCLAAALALAVLAGVCPISAMAAEVIGGGDLDTSWYQNAEPDQKTFELSSAEQLAGLAAIVNGTAKDADGEDIAADSFSGKTVTLSKDVDLGKYTNWTPIGQNGNKAFRGIFDGGGHSITNLTIDTGKEPGQYAGLFGYTSNGMLKKVNIASARISGESLTYAGALVGRTSHTIVTNCSSWAGVSVSGKSTVGGLFGEAGGYKGYVMNCYNAGSVSSSELAGGIAGILSCSVENLYNAGNVVLTGDDGKAGGIFGQVDFYGKNLLRCYNRGAVIAQKPGEAVSAGGLVGTSRGSSSKYGTYAKCFYEKNGILLGIGDEAEEREGISGKTASEFKEAALLSELGAAFVPDAKSINDGYPILKWQQQKDDGNYGYEEETDGLDIAASGIQEESATGFEALMNHKLSYTKLNASDFKVTVQMEGSDLAVNNFSCEVETGEDSSKVVVRFKEILAEKRVKYTIQFRDGIEYTKEFTTEPSANWLGYAADSFAGGTGTKADPYQIATEEQMAHFASDVDTYSNKCFVLTKDLDMGAHNWYAKDFRGNFDGQGHTIKNVKVTNSETNADIGFFAELSSNNTSYIQNLNFEYPQIVGKNGDVEYGRLGVVAGSATNVNIQNCHVIGGTVYEGKERRKSSYGGGIVGEFSATKSGSGTSYVSRCSSTAQVTASYGTGGIAGLIFYGNAREAGNINFMDCYVGGSIQGARYTGGIVGLAQFIRNITISNCYVTAEITDSAKNANVGGLIGKTEISGGYAIGNLQVQNNVCESKNISDGSGNPNSTNNGRLISKGYDIQLEGKGDFNNNYALASMKLNGAITQESINNGDNVTESELATEEFWTKKAGFDLGEKGVWKWNAEAARPILPGADESNLMSFTAMSIVSQPEDAIAYANKPAIFRVVAAGGTGGYTYQWQYKSYSGAWKNIDGATKYFLTVTTRGEGGFAYEDTDLKCVVTDSAGNQIESDVANLDFVTTNFNISKARKDLLTLYNKKKSLDYAGEAFALASAGVDLSDYAFNIPAESGYFNPDNAMAYLYLDAYVLGMDITKYPVTKNSEQDMLEELLSQQDAEKGNLKSNRPQYSYGSDYLGYALAMDMYYAGAPRWGNEQEGTKKGRNGAVEYLLSNLLDYAGGGKSYKDGSNFFIDEQMLTAQGDYVMMMARLLDDPVYGKQAKEAMEDVLQFMEIVCDSTDMKYTRSAARFISAFVAASNATDSTSKKIKYAKLIEELWGKILLSGAVDGKYSTQIGTTAESGDDAATAAVLLALADYQKDGAAFVSYNCKMADKDAADRDLAVLHIGNPVLADLSLETKGIFGSTITWSSSNEKVIDPKTGAVRRSDKDKAVTLTATATKGDASQTRQFGLTVKADTDASTDAVDAVLDKLSIVLETYQDLTMPASSDESVELTWASSNEAVLSPEGKVVRPADGKDAEVTLTATAKKGDVTKTKAFKVTVLAQTEDKAKLAYNQSRAYWLKTKHISGYWNVFAAYSALGDYIQDPANGYTFELEKPKSDWYGVQYGATVMAIVAMGENPYDYNGTNWVELLRRNYGGMYAAPVYSQLGMNAAGADKNDYQCDGWVGISHTNPASMSLGIDIAGWAAVIAADHKGEVGVDEAVKIYLDHLKFLGVEENGNISGNNYISAGCAVVGFAGLMHAGYEDCDPALAPWVNAKSGKSVIDTVYDNNFAGEETIKGYSTQAMIAICDYYNAKYNNRSNGWIECRVSKARLEALKQKAAAVLADKDQYKAASIAAIEQALDAVGKISAERLNAKIADYGEEYYALYDAVRYVKVKDGDEGGDDASKVKVSFRLIGDAAHGDGKHSSYVTWIPTKQMEFEPGEAGKVTVYDVFVKALEEAGLKAEGADKGYVSRIQAPAVHGGYWLGEFDNGKNSGWMFTVNGVHPQDGLKGVTVKDGDSIIWHYIDDYKTEEEKNTWLEAPDVAPTTANKPGTDKPGTDDPGTDKPGTDKPGTDKPGTDKPGTDKPGTDKPGTDKPGTDKPGTDKPGTDKPGTDKPGTDKPSGTDKDAIAKETKAVKAIKVSKLAAKKYKKSGVTLSWKISKTSCKLDGYEVYRSMKKGSGYKLAKAVKTAKYTLKSGLKNKKNYYYRVRGYKSVGGKKVYTGYATVIVNLDKKNAVQTLKLSGLAAKAEKGKVTLTWDDPESMYTLNGYLISQSTKKGSGYKKVGTVKGRKAVIRKGLKKGKTYYFKVQGCIKSGKKTIKTKAATIKVKAK